VLPSAGYLLGLCHDASSLSGQPTQADLERRQSLARRLVEYLAGFPGVGASL